MNMQRVLSLARRVIRQIVRDHRTLGLVLAAPMFVLTLGSILFRAEMQPIPLGVVNEDQGFAVPVAGRIIIGQRIADEIAAGELFEVVMLQRDEIDDQMREGAVQGVVVFPTDFSAEFVQTRQAPIDLQVEGSNPTRSRMIQGGVTEAAMKTLAGLASSVGGLPGSGTGDEVELPINLTTTYLYGGETFDTMDFVAPVYIAFLSFFFVFLLTCVSFLRERSLGTLERLLATPATRLEIILGYMTGLGLLAVAQVAVILFFTIWVLKIHYLGSLWLLFLEIALLAMVGVSMGIVASTFARNEFQVVQFIPIVIIPQGLLGGLFWPVEEMPNYLQPFAYIMPLTYANRALRDVMLKGFGLAEIWPNLVIPLGFVLVILALGALTMRRELA
jgi:ABC-2 type transport system permease protein